MYWKLNVVESEFQTPISRYNFVAIPIIDRNFIRNGYDFI